MVPTVSDSLSRCDRQNVIEINIWEEMRTRMPSLSRCGSDLFETRLEAGHTIFGKLADLEHKDRYPIGNLLKLYTCPRPNWTSSKELKL